MHRKEYEQRRRKSGLTLDDLESVTPLGNPIPIPAVPAERELQPQWAASAAVQLPPLPSLPLPDPFLKRREERFLRAPEGEPAARIVNASPAVLDPMFPARPAISGIDMSYPPPSLPSGEFVVLEQGARHPAGLPQADYAASVRSLHLFAPPFTLRPIFDWPEQRERSSGMRTKTSFAEIFAIAEVARIRGGHRLVEHAGRALAASVLVASGLWIGAHSAHLAAQWVVSRDAATAMGDHYRPNLPAPMRPLASHRSVSPMAWARGVVARRAAVEVTDTFEKGLRAWGAASRSQSLGWSRHADGYVIPSSLALFQPSLGFTDYRLEFLGQIEKTGISWVVRAQDPQNYYAMKFHVIEPGLRPVLAIVHYPVLGGKRGPSVEVPLSIMVHNATAYHVTVDVRGNRFAASIEGQPVDSWTDDAPPSGGVGFFSDSGELARVYWMKVSKNDDWLGRICALLSHNWGGDSETASRDHGSPGPARQPWPNREPLLVTGEGSEPSFSGLRRPPSPATGRRRAWNS